MNKMQKPTRPCYICGSNDWWLTSDRQYLCGGCHPNPLQGASLEPPAAEEKYSPEVLALRDRVKVGNDKLFKAWLQVLEIGDGQERAFQNDRWWKAKEKLSNLCLELQAKGYEDCLYIEDGRKTRLCPTNPEKDNYFCWVCPCSKVEEDQRA